MKKHFYIVLFGLLLGFLITYFVMLGDSELSESLSVWDYTLTAILGILLSYFIYQSTLVLDKLYSFQKNIGVRLLMSLLIHFVVSFLFIYGCLYIYGHYIDEVLNFSVTYNDILIKAGILIFLAILLFEVIYFAYFSYKSYTTYQIASVKQKRKQIELQLRALKSQLSPHFLFNSLNTISSLIYKDISRAEVFIRKLATLYQYTLDSYDKKLVSVQEELNFVNSYLFLIKTRFDRSFECFIELPEDVLQTRIPPLALQMLLENAIKHNQLQTGNPLKVTIDVQGDFISVTNNITDIPHKVSSFKIGLKNINSRYLLLAGKGIQVSNEEVFQVKIPIIV